MDTSCFLSSDVALNIKVLVLNLHGSMPEMADTGSRPVSYADCLSRRTGCAAADMYLDCQLHAHGRPLGLSERTCNMPGSRLRWNEWITFHAKYCDLSPDASVTISLIGSEAPRKTRTIGSARLALFTDTRQLRTGVVKVQFELNATAPAAQGTGTISPDSATGAASAAHDIARLEELSGRHESATAHPDATLDWLNRPTYAHLEERLQVRPAAPHLSSNRRPSYLVRCLTPIVSWHRTLDGDSNGTSSQCSCPNSSIRCVQRLIHPPPRTHPALVAPPRVDRSRRCASSTARALGAHVTVDVVLRMRRSQVLFHERVAPLLQLRQQPSSAPMRGAPAAGPVSSRGAGDASGSASAGLHDAPIVLLSDAEQHRSAVLQINMPLRQPCLAFAIAR